MPAYRLQTLLDLRTKAEDEAKEAFSQAVKALRLEQEKLTRLQEDLAARLASRAAKVQAFLAEVPARGGGISAFQQMNRFEERLKSEEAQVRVDIAQQEDAVKQGEQRLEQRRHEMAEAAREKKAIEKHRETWLQQVKAERAQREELNQEEIGNTLHLQRTRAAEKKS